MLGFDCLWQLALGVHKKNFVKQKQEEKKLAYLLLPLHVQVLIQAAGSYRQQSNSIQKLFLRICQWLAMWNGNMSNTYVLSWELWPLTWWKYAHLASNTHIPDSLSYDILSFGQEFHSICHRESREMLTMEMGKRKECPKDLLDYNVQKPCEKYLAISYSHWRNTPLPDNILILTMCFVHQGVLMGWRRRASLLDVWLKLKLLACFGLWWCILVTLWLEVNQRDSHADGSLN